MSPLGAFCGIWGWGRTQYWGGKHPEFGGTPPWGDTKLGQTWVAQKRHPVLIKGTMRGGAETPAAEISGGGGCPPKMPITGGLNHPPPPPPQYILPYCGGGVLGSPQWVLPHCRGSRAASSPLGGKIWGGGVSLHPNSPPPYPQFQTHRNPRA